MKRAGSIFFLIILFHTQIGYYGQFLILRWQLRREARAAWLASLPDSRFEAISLEEVNTSGKWEEAGEEFSLRDQLYDVIRQRNVDGKTWLYCLDDERESRLIQQSNNITALNQDTPGKKDLRLSFLKMSDTLLPRSQDLLTLTGLPRSQNLPTLAVSLLPFHVSEIPVPPPRA